MEHLLQQDQSVRVLDLEPFEDDRFADRDVEFIQADVSEPEVVSKACDSIDVVIHAAAALPIQSKSKIYQTDFEGTKNTLDSAINQNVDRFVFVSTTAVYGIPDVHPIPEDFPKDPVGHYGKAKRMAEEYCFERWDDIFLSIIRPKTFVGRERLGIMEVLFDWIRRGKNIYVLGDGNNRYQLLDVEDLCEALWLASTHEDADDVFNVGAREFGTINEDMQPVFEKADNGSQLVHLPARPIQEVLRVLETLNLSPIVKWQYDTMDKESWVATDKIRETLGWEPESSNQDAIMANFDWYLEHYDEFTDEGGVTHRVPWDQKILKIIRYFS